MADMWALPYWGSVGLLVPDGVVLNLPDDGIPKLRRDVACTKLRLESSGANTHHPVIIFSLHGSVSYQYCGVVVLMCR